MHPFLPYSLLILSGALLFSATGAQPQPTPLGPDIIDDGGNPRDTAKSTANALLYATPASGTYITDGGWGILEIERNKDGKSSFAIGSVGINAHTCSLEEVIVHGQAHLKSYGDEVCLVSFSQERGTVTVEATYACRYYCGANTSFDGDYRMVSPACIPAAIEHAHITFERLSKQGNDTAARDVFESVLHQCAKTLPELEELGPIRNDLAVTYYKLGDGAACRAVLEPYRVDAAKNDDAIDTYDYAPYEKKNYGALIATVRTTLSFCEKAEERKGQK